MHIASRGRLAVLLVLALLGVTAITASPAAAAPPAAGLIIDSEPGDFVGAGEQAEFRPPTTSIFVTSDDNEFTLKAGETPACAGDDSACLYVVRLGTRGPSWENVTNGTFFENAQKTPDLDHPMIDVRSGDTICTSTNGRFIVSEITYAAAVLTRFVARFEQHCNGDDDALFGQVSFGPDTVSGWYSRTVAPATADFANTRLTQSKTIRVNLAKRDTGDPFSPLGMNIKGPQASAFSIVGNTCVTGSLTACYVDVKFAPTVAGSHTAFLNWKDELAPAVPANTIAPATTGTGRDVPLVGTAVKSELTVTRVGDFANTRVGRAGAPVTFTAINTGGEVVNISDVVITGKNVSSFAVDNGCDGAALQPNQTCSVKVTPQPAAGGFRTATLSFQDDALGAPHNSPMSVYGTMGYFLAQADGNVSAFGDAKHVGDMGDANLNSPVLGMTSTSTGNGYWMVGGDGGVFNFGDAKFHGATGHIPLNQPVMALDATNNDGGYWMVAYDGGVFAFGNAKFHGSMGGKPLNKPVVGMAATPDGSGYWLVASDGGIFAFNAPFVGSMGGRPLNQPIVGMVPTVTGQGYWLIALDGGVFAFGDAGFVGSMGGQALEAPIISIAPTATGKGYWMVDVLGKVFPFGDAAKFGDLDTAGVDDVMAIAATAPFVEPARIDGPSVWPNPLP